MSLYHFLFDRAAAFVVPVLAVCTFLVPFHPLAAEETTEKPMPIRIRMNVAHRGASVKQPENTIPAYVQAIVDGATGAECDVYHSVDGGGIYILGLQSDSVIEGNIIHGIPRASGRAESNGMFLDEGTTGFTIKDNVIYNTEQSSLRFHRAGKNIVRDNILSNREGVPIIRYNNTPEENIEKIGNRDLKPDSPEFIEAVKRIEAIRAGVPAQ